MVRKHHYDNHDFPLIPLFLSPNEVTKRRFFNFEIIFITSFERELQYYKRTQTPSRVVPCRDNTKEKVKSWKNYLRGTLFLRTATPNI